MTDTLAASTPEDTEIPTLPELLASSGTLPSSVLSSSDTSAYLSHLTTLPLSELTSQPAELSSSSAQLTNALTTLCYTSYPTFLSIHSSTSALSSSLSAFSSSLDVLLSSLPSLESSARSFAEDTRSIQKDRRKAALVLEHHDKLHDVLSLPTLLDSCVRNHTYNEALLLAQHAAGLAARFPDNALVQSVKAECDARVQAMLGQLLRMLSEQAKLPALFRAVGFLRKMDVLDEPELALAFLTGRGVYLDGLLKTVEIEKKGVEGDREREKEAYARYLKRYVDLWREGVYDVVTQYTTIFLERAPSTSGTAPTQLHMLLTTFTGLHLQRLLALLRETLPHIQDPSLLTSLLTQLTYCANSFARVGMDFKGLLAPIFVDAVRMGVQNELEEAADGWCDALKPSTSLSSYRSKATSKRPSRFLVAASAAPSPPLPTDMQLQALSSGPPNVPPPILVSYPPLATYTNAILTALNGLRLLAPVELLDDLLQALDTSLARGLDTLLTLARDRPWTSEPKYMPVEDEEQKETEVIKAAAAVYVKMFLPFMRRALVEGVYGVKVGDVDAPPRKDLGVALEGWEHWGAESNGDAAEGH
ncbi:Dor1-like family-domain-containing protein [Fomitopsis serialis]|uniref:Dor1-like family-domain-containing protein n=1 Tax=Fomitopsis serialis TaxID=139415 RepID=UPI002008D46A|nr:Dor1-like family-domain-containing protein [Neoantrodia serialis]KAH9936985.1 Dor1-like family-domain-containing protein [Neoantrodia serialis]